MCVNRIVGRVTGWTRVNVSLLLWLVQVLRHLSTTSSTSSTHCSTSCRPSRCFLVVVVDRCLAASVRPASGTSPCHRHRTQFQQHHSPCRHRPTGIRLCRVFRTQNLELLLHTTRLHSSLSTSGLSHHIINTFNPTDRHIDYLHHSELQFKRTLYLLETCYKMHCRFEEVIRRC